MTGETMTGEKTSHDASSTETVTRDDDEVGTSGGSAAGGGRQTADQAAIVQMGDGGRTDAERHEAWKNEAGSARQSPPAVGGSSGGQSDRKPATEGEGS